MSSVNIVLSAEAKISSGSGCSGGGMEMRVRSIVENEQIEERIKYCRDGENFAASRRRQRGSKSGGSHSQETAWEQHRTLIAPQQCKCLS